MIVEDICKLVPDRQRIVIEDAISTKWLYEGINKKVTNEVLKKRVLCVVSFNTTLILQVAEVK